MATPINPLPNLTQYNFDIGDIEEVVTKQNGVNAVLEQLGPQINATVASINTDMAEIETVKDDLNPALIVHAPGSGLSNEAGAAYSRGVVGGSGNLMANGAFGLGDPEIGELVGPLDDVNGTRWSRVADTASLPIINGVQVTLAEVLTVGLTSARQQHLTVINPGTIRGVKANRVRASSAWQPWVIEYSSTNLVGTVAQVGGVPTGAAMENDSNSFGDWVKFADGSIFFSSLIEAVDINIGMSAGNIYRSADITWTLPQTVIGPVSAWGRVTNAGAGIGVHVAGGGGSSVSSITAIRAYIDSSGGLTNRQVQLNGWAKWY